MTEAPHIPVLITSLIDRAAPVQGRWVDGTFGAGGYTRYLLDAGADHVTGVDQDPTTAVFGAQIAQAFPGQFDLIHCNFAEMADHIDGTDGVVLDLGVSSMQLDQAERGFSFMKDGPLDMRMGDKGATAADLVNTLSEVALAEILFVYGEERASRRIAKAIVARRLLDPFTMTLDLADVIASQLPRPKPGQSHPATRSFQALRIAVNEEYDVLASGLSAAERILKPGGILAVVTFHSVEDRIVKRFFQARAGTQQGSRYSPAATEIAAQFDPMTRKAIAPGPDELAANPRARSAKLRMGRRTDAPAMAQDDKALGVPKRVKGDAR